VTTSELRIGDALANLEEGASIRADPRGAMARSSGLFESVRLAAGPPTVWHSVTPFDNPGAAGNAAVSCLYGGGEASEEALSV
jgi:hypothetical protein